MHWTIIGGGLQGTTIALKLKNEGLKNEALTIIDPYSSLCERFNIYTQRISMPYLRSPFVHHIHPKPFISNNMLDIISILQLITARINVLKEICLCIMFMI